MTSEVEIPQVGAALEDPATQRAVRRVEQRVWRRFALWGGAAPLLPSPRGLPASVA